MFSDAELMFNVAELVFNASELMFNDVEHRFTEDGQTFSLPIHDLYHHAMVLSA